MRSGSEQNGGREKKSEEEEEGGRWGKGSNLFRKYKQEVKEMNGNLGP